MSTISSTLHVKGLARRQVAEFSKRADRLGMTPERYLKYLVEEDLAISREAKTSSFADLMGPGREVDERELDRLVESAKAKYHRRASRKE